MVTQLAVISMCVHFFSLGQFTVLPQCVRSVCVRGGGKVEGLDESVRKIYMKCHILHISSKQV